VNSLKLECRPNLYSCYVTGCAQLCYFNSCYNISISYYLSSPLQFQKSVHLL